MSIESYDKRYILKFSFMTSNLYQHDFMARYIFIPCLNLILTSYGERRVLANGFPNRVTRHTPVYALVVFLFSPHNPKYKQILLLWGVSLLTTS